MGSFEPDLIRHNIIRHVRYRNRDVEQKKDKRPNVDTAANPCDSTWGSGDKVALSGESGMAVDKRHQEKQRLFSKRTW